MFIFKQESGEALLSGDTVTLSVGGKALADFEIVRSEASKGLFLARAKKYYGSPSFKTGEAFTASRPAPLAAKLAQTAPVGSQEPNEANRNQAPEGVSRSEKSAGTAPEMAYDEIDVGEPANRAPESPRRFFVYTGLGVSHWSYSENSAGQAELSGYSLTGLDVSVLLRFILSSRFYLNADGSMTALALADNATDTTGRFYSAEGQLGYVAVNGKRVLLQVLAGWYYRTITSSNDVFGVANLMGSQLYPRLVFRFNSKNSLAFYARYSPLWDGFKPMALTNREIGVGVEWFRQVSSTNNISLRLDFQSLHLKHKLAEIGTIDDSNFGLTLGYYW
jgi:hypothetical protein